MYKHLIYEWKENWMKFTKAAYNRFVRGMLQLYINP